MLRFVICVVVFFYCSLAANAQVYRWTDPQTGGTHISNIPPAWYTNPGTRTSPRVAVYENGRMIDDTGLKAEQRLELRANRGTSRGLAPVGGGSSAQPRQLQ